ncbi:MAG: hypothetical protein KJ804_19855 [Proteobacteria bacterium]|nr:hypothetical protein [Pseudomonadota bacterium]
MANENLFQKVTQINGQLRAFGREAVQEIKMMKDGEVIGQVRYGYKPQYVFDTVNNVLQPENWRYEVVSKEIFDTQAVIEVKLFIRLNDEWLCKGSQTGQMQIIKKNVGDAYKGAITDALQKCFSLLSIGSDAYKGLLKDVYLAGNRSLDSRQQPPVQQSAQPPVQKQPAENTKTNQAQPDSINLPKIAGVDYQRKNGMVVAVGKVYEKRDLLKSAGFKWDKSDKSWIKQVLVQ